MLYKNVTHNTAWFLEAYTMFIKPFKGRSLLITFCNYELSCIKYRKR